MREININAEAVEIGRKILTAFRNQSGIFSGLHSEALNDIGLEKDLYLNYLTFTSAVDYLKNLPANDLWKAAKRWVKKYPWLYNPKKLWEKPLHDVVEAFKQIRAQDAKFLRIKDIGIWLLISDALRKYEGKTSKLLEYFDYDAWRIYQELRLARKEFPFLSGDKILPMWIKIMKEDAGLEFKNMDKLPLPVDKNVAEITHNVILKRSFDGTIDKDTREIVRSVWSQIANQLHESVIDFDTALWTLGGKQGCSNQHHTKCKSCPVRTHCSIYA